MIACVSCFKRARWDIFALFWLLAILQIEAYWNFPDSFSRETVLKFVKDAQANTVSRRERTQRALFGRFAPSEIHEDP